MEDLHISEPPKVVIDSESEIQSSELESAKEAREPRSISAE